MAKMRCYRMEGVGVSKCSRHPIFNFFIKENWICAITRHHAEPNNILLTRNLAVKPSCNDTIALFVG